MGSGGGSAESSGVLTVVQRFENENLKLGK
jgi:hypothetical protein